MRQKSVLCTSLILFIFCYVFLQANLAVSGTNSGIGLDFQALLEENISKDARVDGLRLKIRTNNWDQRPASHAEMVQCVDKDGGWNPDRSGFSVVDLAGLNTNPHGENSDYTAKYSGFFLVEEEGYWQFAVNSFGPSEIEIDGRVTAFWYGDHDSGNFFDDHSVSMRLTAGWHRIVFRYAVNDGTPYAEARFKFPSGNSWEKVSSTNLNLKSFPVADGLQLITKKNIRDIHAVDHDDLYVFVEIQLEEHIDYYGWSLVDELDQTENIHGNDVGYTSRYETYFEVSEEQAGDWQFALDSGDAAELKINNEIAVSWYDGHEPSGDTSHNATVTLQAGWHRLVLRNALNGATATNKVMF